LLEARMLGLEFSADSKTVLVVFQATMMVPEVGVVTRTGREPWVWDGKDWFLRLEDQENPFIASRNHAAAAALKPVRFELSSQTLDLGSHVQGEIVRTTIDFKATQEAILGIRVTELPGLTIVPDWTSSEGGRIELALDTSLHPESINQRAELHIVDLAQLVTRIPITITAAIEPRLRFAQSPQILNPTQAGMAEIRIENLSDTPFELTSASPTNERYHITNYTSGKIAPGQSLIITLAYDAQRQPIGTELNIKLSEPLLTKPDFNLPLNIRLAPVSAPGYTKDQLDDLVRKAKD
jgi:hypothetical protein